MPRRKKPENETQEEALIRQELETIANTASRSEKTSWNRKMNNMVSLLAKLKPIEDKILELIKQKESIFDEIQELRSVMVKECVHPFDQLIYKGDYIECKFCNRKLNLNDDKKKT